MEGSEKRMLSICRFARELEEARVRNKVKFCRVAIFAAILACRNARSCQQPTERPGSRRSSGGLLGIDALTSYHPSRISPSDRKGATGLSAGLAACAVADFPVETQELSVGGASAAPKPESRQNEGPAGRAYDHEADLSAVQAHSQAPSRLPCAHGHRWWPQGDRPPPGPGPQASVGVIGPRPWRTPAVWLARRLTCSG